MKFRIGDKVIPVNPRKKESFGILTIVRIHKGIMGSFFYTVKESSYVFIECELELFQAKQNHPFTKIFQ